MFGFSFGGQLVTEAGRRIGFQRLQFIDSMRHILSVFFCLYFNYKFSKLVTWPVQDLIIAYRPIIDWPPRMYSVCTRAATKGRVTIIVIKIGVWEIVVTVKMRPPIRRSGRTVCVHTFTSVPLTMISMPFKSQPSVRPGRHRLSGQKNIKWATWNQEKGRFFSSKLSLCCVYIIFKLKTSVW